jgi:hypothetical protein
MTEPPHRHDPNLRLDAARVAAVGADGLVLARTRRVILELP